MELAKDGTPLVPKSRQSDYLAEHGLTLEVLPNGLMFFSGHKVEDDTPNMSASVNFSTGAYNDPKDKEGLHHVAEHLAVDHRLQDIGSGMYVEVNASTGHSLYQFRMSGLANPDIPEFGIWPLIPGFKRMLMEPFTHYGNLKQSLDTEKGVVLREVAERNTPRSDMLRFRERCIYGPSNPIHYPSGGTEEGIRRITEADVLQLGQEVFIPKGTRVGVFTTGLDRSVNHFAVQSFLEGLDHFPRGDREPNPVDQALLDLLNPDFKMGETYIYPHSRQSVREIEFLWLLPANSQAHRFALSRVSTLLGKTVHDFVRQMGWSYGGGFTTSNEGEFRLCSIKFPVEANGDLPLNVRSKYLDKIRTALSSIQDEAFYRVWQSEQQNQRARGLSSVTRYNAMLSGIRDYGQIVDMDALKGMYKAIEVEHLKTWRDAVVATDPAIMIL